MFQKLLGFEPALLKLIWHLNFIVYFHNFLSWDRMAKLHIYFQNCTNHFLFSFHQLKFILILTFSNIKFCFVVSEFNLG